MELTKGMDGLKQKINQHLTAERNAWITSFNSLETEVKQYVSDSAGAYKSLESFDPEKAKPKRGNEPDGFSYGYEIVPKLNIKNENIYFPLLYPFLTKRATAIEEGSEFAPFFFNFALRSIISYPLGDCNVYLVDANVSGDFNQLSGIYTRLEEADAEKPYFHYLTMEDERSLLLTELMSIMDSNIRNYVSGYEDLSSYNNENQSMHVPYHFVFIKDIVKAYPNKSQIEKLTKLILSDNARKAGIFLFYTFDRENLKEDPDSYYADTPKALRNLLSMSHIMSRPERLYPSGGLRVEPMATAETANRVKRFVETQKPPISVMTFREVIKQKLSKGDLWNPPFKRQKAHLPFIVGFQNAVKPKEVDVCFKGTSPHIFIGGKTGSGKSILLHNFIINGALRYPPEQLQFYLVDMKGGVSFVPYKHLPHVVALSASSSRHYAMSLLELFSEEHNRRLSLFKREGAPSLDAYNEAQQQKGKKPLPFLFGIIDEFQGLFDSMDEISQNAERLIKEIHKLSRATGIFLALCTQQAPGNVDRSQVGIKMSLVCNPNDSMTLIGNTAASRLRGIGRALININPTGEEKYNQEFQVAFIDEQKELPAYVARIQEIYLHRHNGKDPLDHLIFDDNDRGARLPSWIGSASQDTGISGLPFIYVGIPGFFRKEHVKFLLHRDSQSNVVIVGNDRASALRLTGIIALQFLELYKKTGAKVFITDMQKMTTPTYNKLGCLSGIRELTHTTASDFKKTLTEVHQILCKRKENPDKSVYEPEVLYAILDIKPDNNFTASNSSGFSFDEISEKTPITMLSELIEDGPDLGIHVLVYGYNYPNIESVLNTFNNSLLPKMEIKIALRGGNSAKVLRFFASGEPVEHYGEGVILMPEDMGLRYKDENDCGDPFIIYDSLGDRRFSGTPWEKLFINLPNQEI